MPFGGDGLVGMIGSWDGAFEGPDKVPPPWTAVGIDALAKSVPPAIILVLQQGWLQREPFPSSSYWEPKAGPSLQTYLASLGCATPTGTPIGWYGLHWGSLLGSISMSSSRMFHRGAISELPGGRYRYPYRPARSEVGP